MPSPMDTEYSPGIPRSSKRRRLNFACNYCRSRKTRCDEQQPSCQACILAGVTCVIKRREAGKSTDGGSVTSASPSEYGLQTGAVERRHSVAEPRTIEVVNVTGPIRVRSQSPRPSQSRDSSHTDTINIDGMARSGLFPAEHPLPFWLVSPVYAKPAIGISAPARNPDHARDMGAPDSIRCVCKGDTYVLPCCETRPGSCRCSAVAPRELNVAWC
ncbi:hypothetical protein LB503_008443 [Fusarium chuoi]|nr:hypothetical protein LB503_008443 [Fusarium chuoi]